MNDKLKAPQKSFQYHAHILIRLLPFSPHITEHWITSTPRLRWKESEVNGQKLPRRWGELWKIKSKHWTTRTGTTFFSWDNVFLNARTWIVQWYIYIFTDPSLLHSSHDVKMVDIELLWIYELPWKEYKFSYQPPLLFSLRPYRGAPTGGGGGGRNARSAQGSSGGSSNEMFPTARGLVKN